MEVTIYRNMCTAKLEFRVIKYEDKKAYYMHDGDWLECGYNEIPPIMSLPLNTEIKTDLPEKNYKALLDQKDKDKSCHIEDLKSLLEMTIKLNAK